MIQVGVTGGIGSGKTTVCRIFETLGIPVFYADAEAKALYDRDPALKAQLIAAFGAELYAGGKFQPAILRESVFRDPDRLALLNSLVHPRVIAEAENWMQRQTSPYVLKEAALLVESGSYKKMDRLIVVVSPQNLRIERVVERDGLQAEEVQDRIGRQLPEEELLAHAHFVIRNDPDHALIPQVLAVHRQLLALAGLPG